MTDKITGKQLELFGARTLTNQSTGTVIKCILVVHTDIVLYTVMFVSRYEIDLHSNS